MGENSVLSVGSGDHPVEADVFDGIEAKGDFMFLLPIMALEFELGIHKAIDRESEGKVESADGGKS